MNNKKAVAKGTRSGEKLPAQAHGVTRAMVNRRAHELASLADRKSPKVIQIDYEQAKRDVTGESDLDRQNAALDEGADKA